MYDFQFYFSEKVFRFGKLSNAKPQMNVTYLSFFQLQIYNKNIILAQQRKVFYGGKLPQSGKMRLAESSVTENSTAVVSEQIQVFAALPSAINGIYTPYAAFTAQPVFAA